jgi:hypothetical protein
MCLLKWDNIMEIVVFIRGTLEGMVDFSHEHVQRGLKNKHLYSLSGIISSEYEPQLA